MWATRWPRLCPTLCSVTLVPTLRVSDPLILFQKEMGKMWSCNLKKRTLNFWLWVSIDSYTQFPRLHGCVPMQCHIFPGKGALGSFASSAPSLYVQFSYFSFLLKIILMCLSLSVGKVIYIDDKDLSKQQLVKGRKKISNTAVGSIAIKSAVLALPCFLCIYCLGKIGITEHAYSPHTRGRRRNTMSLKNIGLHYKSKTSLRYIVKCCVKKLRVGDIALW